MAIIENGIKPEDSFRTAVVGLIAMWHSREDPFEPRSLRYTERVTNNALESMPPVQRELAARTYREIAAALNEAYAKQQNSN